MRRWLGLTQAVLLALTAVAHAQETTGTLSGRVTDGQGLSVPGVTITVAGPQGTKTAVTDPEGRFTVPFLTPGAYGLRAELQGFKALERNGVQVRLGQTIDLPLTLEVGALSESVQVTGGLEPLTATGTTIGASLDSATLSVMPVGRRFSDTLYLAPGVSSSGSLGSANPSVSGASGLENQYVVDGVNITNGGYGALGSYSIVFGSLGNGTPYDFMQEVQVKTGGYEAEYGQATGGVINVVTKSGSNDLRGSAFGYVQPKAFEAGRKLVETTNGTVNTTGLEQADGGVTVGAPIIRNHLFVFGALDPQRERRTLVAPPGFPLESLGDVDRDRRVVNYAAKGTWQLTPEHRFDASFFGDPAHGANGPQRSTALLRPTTSGFSELNKYGGNNETLHYNGVIGPKFLIDASLGRSLNQIEEVPSENTWFVTDRTVVPNVNSGGIGFYEAGNMSRSWQYLAKATNIFGGAGQHQLSYGLDYEHLNYDQVNQRTGPVFTTPVGDLTATGAEIQILPDPVFGSIYRVSRANLNAARSTTQNYTAFFVEDSWQIGNRLTVRPGVRYEQEKLAGTIIKDLTLDNNWAPRIGATWDATGDGRTKVFGSYGRYYARVPNDLAARALSSDASITADYFDAQLTQPIPNGVLAGPDGLQTATHYTLLGGGADTIDPNVKLSYSNEYIAGVEHDLFRNLIVSARYIHRNIGRVLEDVQPFPIVATDLGVAGAATADYTLTNPGPDTAVLGDLGASFETPTHTYNAVELTADRRLSDNWSLLASYRWSRLRGTYEGFYRDDNGQSDPGITSLYDFPTSDPSYTAIGVPQFGYSGDVRYLGSLGEGPLPLDRPHQVKLYGSYQLHVGLTLAGGLNIGSGKPLTAFAASPVYQNGGEIPLTPRGDGFQTSDGFRTRTPWTTTVDGHAQYDLKLGSHRDIVLVADMFNLFNQQTVTDYDNYFESTFGSLNPDFGQAGASSVVGGQQLLAPRQIRIGARLQF
jgi:Carboxypeptidase regulatory-like domain/TonB dependent receptor-like, beta-barrel